MSFLTLSDGTTTLTVAVRSNAAEQLYDEHRVDRQRMFDGTMRVVAGSIWRKWSLTTKHESDYAPIVALLKSGDVPLTASGDLTDGEDVAVMPRLVSASPVQTANGFKRLVVFDLYETLDTQIATLAPWLFLRSGAGYYSDTDKTTPAAGADALVKVWADSSGNGRDAVLRSGYSDEMTPLLQKSNTAIRFGDSSRTGGRGAFQMPYLGGFSSGEIMLAVQRESTPADNSESAIFQLGAQGNGNDDFPRASDGHIWSTFGTAVSGGYDCGSPGINLTSRFHVININSSSSEWCYRLDNEVLRLVTTSLNPAFDVAASSGGTLGENVLGGHFNGWIRNLVIFNTVLTDAQRASWYAFVNGDTDEAPLPE